METNFFQSIAALQVGGGWSINITNETAERMIVSVLYFDNTVGDDARKQVPPMLLKGTAQELDEGFFAAIAKPVQETAALFANMETFLKRREEAKLASQMAKEKKAAEDRDKTEKQKKYEEAMKKVDELEAEGKFRDAWVKVPLSKDYPDNAEILDSRRSSLSAQFAPDLFN